MGKLSVVVIMMDQLLPLGQILSKVWIAGPLSVFASVKNHKHGGRSDQPGQGIIILMETAARRRRMQNKSVHKSAFDYQEHHRKETAERSKGSTILCELRKPGRPSPPALSDIQSHLGSPCLLFYKHHSSCSFLKTPGSMSWMSKVQL